MAFTLVGSTGNVLDGRGVADVEICVLMTAGGGGLDCICAKIELAGGGAGLTPGVRNRSIVSKSR